MHKTTVEHIIIIGNDTLLVKSSKRYLIFKNATA